MDFRLAQAPSLTIFGRKDFFWGGMGPTHPLADACKLYTEDSVLELDLVLMQA